MNGFELWFEELAALVAEKMAIYIDPYESEDWFNYCK